MGLILNIETTSPVCSACLAQEGEILAFREDDSGTSHARLLTVFIHELLDETKRHCRELDAVAVSAGPGSYTGLRVGYSVAKGLCYSLDKPLIAVPTLHSLFAGMMQQTGDREACYLPVMDARRMDVYTALIDAKGEEKIAVSAPALDAALEQRLIQFGKVYVGGNAVEKCRKVFTAPQIHYLDHIRCDSRWMARLSETAFIQNHFQNVAYSEPFYLKEFGGK